MISKENLTTKTLNTWCPGCSNFALLNSFQEAIIELCQEKKIKLENIVVASGIGCHGKIVDYLNLNSFYSLHGRVIPVLTGMKLANPKILPIGFAGDGDAYGEGMEHLIFAAKRNSNITLIVHNNRVFALTTGQFTPTSPQGFPGRSTPQGNPEAPLNPLKLMLACNATFVARGYTGRPNHLKEIFKKAILHQGFSFVDVLQPCLSFFNTFSLYNEKVYELENINHNFRDKKAALKRIEEWDYNSQDSKIALGIFYQEEKETFEEKVLEQSRT